VPARASIAVLAATLTIGFTASGVAGAAPSATGAAAVPGLPPGVAAADSVPAGRAAAAALSRRAASLPKVTLPMRQAKGPVTAFVELAATSAVDAAADQQRKGAGKDAAKRAARDARSNANSVATAVFGQARSRDGSARELYRTSNAVPGIMVHGDAAALRDLAARPDVVSVKLATPATPTNASAVQLTKTLQAWQSTGRFGDGVRIGIIDTGTDYTHADFGGPGTTAAYQAIDPTKVDPSFFPTAKVVGGTDFAGNAYDAANATDPNVFTPKPDPNPLDCNSHGTHVSGTAAGFGENADGSTFTGDYRSLTPDALNAMKIGPGTAPKALLYSLKVFGCTGSTNLVEQALDWSLDPDQDGDFADHLDVVNLSLGSDFGAEDDPEAAFVKKAADNGVLPVIAAGNGGDLYDVGGTPGNAPAALAVASSRDGFVLYDAAQVTAPAAQAGNKAGQYSVNFPGYATLDLTRPVAALTDPANPDGCAPFSAADAAAVAGKFAWLEWDDNDATRRCGSGARTNNAQAAGAAGVVLSSGLNLFNAGIAGNAGIPVFQFTADTSTAIRAEVKAGTVSVRMAGSLRNSVKTFPRTIEDTISGFSSRGNRGPAVKPDVTAPGDTIVSAGNGTGNGVLVDSGTSMATPHTAGIAALVRQAHPDWTVEEVKAAVMDTADADVFTGENRTGTVYPPMRTGTGRVDGQAAVNNQVLALVEDDPGVVSVSFGTVEAAGPVHLTKTVKVVNKGTTAATYSVGYTAATSQPGVKFTVDRPSVTLSPRGVARVRVSLDIADPRALRRTPDPTTAPTQLDVPREYVADASGRLVLTPSGGGANLRVPVYAAAKPVSDITTADRLRVNGTQGVLNLAGRGVNQGTGTQRYLSLVSALELQATSPRLPDCGAKVTGCVVNGTARGADLRFVGAASTAPLAKAQGNPADALLGFGVVTFGNLYNLGSNTQIAVDIDTTGDGTPDFETFSAKLTGTDIWVAETARLSDGTVVDLEPINTQFGDVDTNVFDTNAWVLPVAISTLGIDPTAASARISYQVATVGFYSPGGGGGLIDSTDHALSFDALRPGLWVQGGGDPALAFKALPGTALVVNRDAAALAADGSSDLLLIYHQNASGDRAQTVRINGGGGAAGPPHHPRAV
jgi:subtilisin family serine protease